MIYFVGSTVDVWVYRTCETVGRITDFAFTVGVFLYVLILGLALQLIVLPLLIPSVHAEIGLIVGFDSVGFHNIARVQADLIDSDGWSAWTLRPADQAPAGIASVMYVLLKPLPAAMLPINALLFATAVVAARGTLSTVFQHRGAATLAILPFLLFPSFSLVWGQIHKDVFVGAGLMLIVNALVVNFATERPLSGGVLIAAAGAMLIWIARGYALEVTIGATLIFAGILAAKHPRKLLRTLPIIGVLLLIAILGRESGHLSSWTASDNINNYTDEAEHELALNACSPLPNRSVVDHLLYSFCNFRHSYVMSFPTAGSNIDVGLELREFTHFLTYAPRSLQLSLLAPTPFLSSNSVSSEIGRVGRLFVSTEMLFAYIVFTCALVLGLKRARFRLLLAATVAMLVAYIVVHSYAIPNLGTLYRMRLFAFSLIVSIAFGLTILWSRHRAVENVAMKHKKSGS